MRLHYDVDLQRFVIGANTSQELSSLTAKRSPNLKIEIQFFHSDSPDPIELDPGATGVFEIKETGKYDADAIAAALSWTKTGTGVNTLYTFVLNLQVEELNELLGIEDPQTVTVNSGTDLFTGTASPPVDSRIQFSTDNTLPAPLDINQDYFVISGGHTGTTFKISLTSGGGALDITDTGTGTHKFRIVSDDIASLPLMAAMQYVEGGTTNESQTLVFNLENDVCRDGDTSPTATVETVIINTRVGKSSLSAGIDYLDVTFSTPFAGGANVGVCASVQLPSGGEHIGAWIREDLTSETGTRIEFSATIPATGYKLAYLAFQI